MSPRAGTVPQSLSGATRKCHGATQRGVRRGPDAAHDDCDHDHHKDERAKRVADGRVAARARRGRGRRGHGSCGLEMRSGIHCGRWHVLREKARMAQSVSGITAVERIAVRDAGSRSRAAEGETATRNVDRKIQRQAATPKKQYSATQLEGAHLETISQHIPGVSLYAALQFPDACAPTQLCAHADLNSDKDLAVWMPRLWPCLTTLAAAHTGRDLGIDL